MLGEESSPAETWCQQGARSLNDDLAGLLLPFLTIEPLPIAEEGNVGLAGKGQSCGFHVWTGQALKAF